MTAIGPLFALIAVAVYGAAIIGVVILVQAVVRISHALTRLSQSVEEIAAAMRSGTARH